MIWLWGGLVTLLAGVVLTPLVRAWARGRGMVAQPRVDRWHRQPTALMGGVAIYAAFVIGVISFGSVLPGGGALILGGGTLLFIAGLVDDYLNIKPPIKLVIQVVVAAVVVYFGRRLPWTGYEAVNVFITIFWLVGITNAINLLDNMDGLAGGVTVISCAFLTITFLLNGQTAEALLPALVGGAALGFLVYNFNPASIFMGDSGSMFLGFMLGAMALLSDYDRTRNVGTVLLTPLLILMIPILDTCIVTVTRKLSGRPVSQGGRDHSSHRLVALGIPERRAVVLLYALAAASGLIALLVRGTKIDVMLPVVAVYTLVMLFIGLYLGKVQIYEGGERRPNNTTLNALADFSYKRRVFEILLDVVLVVVAYNGAYLLRFDGGAPPAQMDILLRSLPLVIAIQMLCFLVLGVYQGLWRYAGLSDLIVIAKSVGVGVAASAGVIFAMYGLAIPSKAVFMLDALLLIFLMGASRVSFRLLRTVIVGHAEVRPHARPVVIYGAGDGGELLLREILNNAELQFTPVGFVDDDGRKAGKLIHGFRIYQSREWEDLMRRHQVRDVLVSSSKVPDTRLDQLREMGFNLWRMSIRIEMEPSLESVLPKAGAM